MSVLACGELNEGRVLLRRLGEGAPFDGLEPFDALLLSRLDCDMRLVDIPPVADREVEGLLRYRLRSIYPGSPQETVFDYRLVGEGQERRAVFFIARRATLELYRAAAGQRRLLLPYALLERIGRARGAVRIWFVAGEWLELLVFRAGRLVSSTVQRVSSTDGAALARADAELSAEVRELPALCAMAQPGAREVPPGMGTVTPEELASAARRAEGVFGTQKRRLRLPGTRARAAILGVAAAVLAVCVLSKHVGMVEQRAADLRAAYASLEGESRRVLAIQKDVEELEAAVSRLEGKRPQDMYAALSALGEVLGEEARIATLTIRDGAFQVEAVGTNPLLLMEGFGAQERFRDVKLSQVFPDARSGKERFSFSGAIRAR